MRSITSFDAAIGRAVAGCPPHRYMRLRFEDFIADPLAQLANIYAGMKFGSFKSSKALIAREVERRQGYQGRTAPLDADQRTRLVAACGATMAIHGYLR